MLLDRFGTRTSPDRTGTTVRRGTAAEIAALILAGCAAGLVALYLFPTTVREPISIAAISASKNHAYAAPLPFTNRLLDSGGDSSPAPYASRLRLLEDGRELGPPHSIHEGVASSGAGRFSHWGNHLIFSASDNSDPRSNGRVYEASYRMGPAPWLLALTLGAFLACAGVAWRRSWLSAGRIAPLARRAAASIPWAVFAFAALATLTPWLPFPGRIEVVAWEPVSLAVGDRDKRPGQRWFLPFERLVAPFMIVPSGDDESGGYIVASTPGRALREVTSRDAWLAAADAVFLDLDRIGGEGVAVYLPPGHDAPSTSEFILRYRAAATPGAIGLLWSAFAIILLASMVWRRMDTRRAGVRLLSAASAGLAAAGLGLVALNLAGAAQPLRDEQPRIIFPSPTTSRDLSVPWQGAEVLERDTLPSARETNEGYVVRMNELVSQNLVHAWNYANSATMRLHVPASSNFVLWLLGETHARLYRYHYAQWRPALWRGTGMCAQASLILVGILRERGYDARVVQLSGHTVVTVEASPGRWNILDPDIGVALPESLHAIERDPEVVRAPYAQAYERLGHLDPGWAAAAMVGIYAPEGNHIEPRGGNEMLGDPWVVREHAADLFKWAIPVLLLLAAAGLAAWGRRLGNSHEIPS